MRVLRRRFCAMVQASVFTNAEWVPRMLYLGSGDGIVFANARLKTSARWHGIARLRVSIMKLSGVELSTRVEMVVVEQRVEDQEITADRGSAINRIIRVQHDVSFPKRDIDDNRSPRYVASIQQPGGEQLALVSKAQNDARPQCRRNDRQRVPHLLVRDRCCLPWLDRTSLRNVEFRVKGDAPLRNIQIFRRTTTGWSRGRRIGGSSATRAEHVGAAEVGPLVAVDR